MRVELTGHHVDISPGLRRLVDRKLAKVLRVLNDAVVSATVVVTREKINNVVELTLHARGERFLHAVGKADSWETAMTDVVAKVMHQTEKVKGKWQERKRRGPAARSVKTPRPARRAASRAAAPVTGGEPTSERPPAGARRTPRTIAGGAASPRAAVAPAAARKRR
jgi:putative sigma-54 modulation protein